MTLVSKVEAAKQLGLSKMRLDRILRVSGIKEQPSITDGRVLLVDVDAVKAYLETFPKGSQEVPVNA